MFDFGLKQTSFRDFELTRELSGILIFLKFRQLSKSYEAMWDFTKLETLRNKRGVDFQPSLTCTIDWKLMFGMQLELILIDKLISFSSKIVVQFSYDFY